MISQTPRRHILPPATTPLERAVDQTLPAWGWMADCAEPSWIARDPQFTPWLAVDWQVAQFAVYFDSVDALLAAAIPWLMQRGNPASVRTALRWIGFSEGVSAAGPPQGAKTPTGGSEPHEVGSVGANIVLDEDGAWLHLDPGHLVSNEDLIPVAHVVRASIPAHVRFYRVFHGWDLRPVKTDSGWLDDALLDDDSGAWMAVDPYGGPIKVSQGQTYTGSTSAPLLADARAAQEAVFTAIVTYDDRPTLDAWRLDSAVLVDASGGTTLLSTVAASGYVRVPAQGLPPAIVQSRECAWFAPPSLAGRTAIHAGTAGRPNDDARTWVSGAWDSTPWRPFFTSLIVTEQA